MGPYLEALETLRERIHGGERVSDAEIRGTLEAYRVDPGRADTPEVPSVERDIANLKSARDKLPTH